MNNSYRVRIDGVETVLTFDSYSGARGHQYLTPGNVSSHALPFPLARMKPGEKLYTNGHVYEFVSSR